ncbi:MAG: hypothetical protein KDJ47_01780 [Hyphomicrobiaceae bacterium]|nr:hypothetical protein [Hyphomicrobiaceae bacterium]
MNRTRRKEPLYRKVNTRTHGVHHHSGGDYRHLRNTKSEKRAKDDGVTRGTMHGEKRRGLDYTPLFRFLLSKVGQDWAGIHAEAVSRLDREDPIFWMVARTPDERKDYVRIGETSYYSGLYVDEAGKLALVAPGLQNEHMKPSCPCCTYTFNGVPFVRRYEAL